MWDLAKRDQRFCVADLERAHYRKYLIIAEGNIITYNIMIGALRKKDLFLNLNS